MTRQQQRAVLAFHGGMYGMSGLGATSQQITNMIGGSLMATGSVLAKIPGLQLAGAVTAAAGALTSLIGGLFKPDVTKIEATKIVDQIEGQVLKPTLATWQTLPQSQKTVSMQAHYLNIVDQALNAVQQGCSNPALGTAGQNCISERLIKGGSAPWCPTGTGCDWISLYRDPIANDPNVIPDPTIADQAGDTISGVLSSSGPGGIPMPLLLGAGLLFAAFAMGD